MSVFVNHIHFKTRFWILFWILPILPLQATDTGDATYQNAGTVQSMSLHELFDYLSHHTSYDFFYNSNLPGLQKKVEVNPDDPDVAKTLQKALKHTGLEFNIQKNKVLIRRKSKADAKPKEEKSLILQQTKQIR